MMSYKRTRSWKLSVAVELHPRISCAVVWQSWLRRARSHQFLASRLTLVSEPASFTTIHHTYYISHRLVTCWKSLENCQCRPCHQYDMLPQRHACSRCLEKPRSKSTASFSAVPPTIRYWAGLITTIMAASRGSGAEQLKAVSRRDTRHV